MKKYVIPEKIEILKRRKERILFNPEHVNPLYFPKGGDIIIGILRELKKKEPFEKPPQKICQTDLFDFLCSHSIIIGEDMKNMTEGKQCIHCGIDCDRDYKTTENNILSDQKTIYLLLSQSCNQACIYCLNGKKTYEKEKNLLMTEDIAFKSIRKTIETIRDRGKLEIVFFGGEPLLNWPLAKKIIHYCEDELRNEHPSKTFAYHLTTNLTLMPDDLTETAKKHNMTFLVNIDGPEEIHDRTRPFVDGRGTFKITSENIKKLANEGFNVSLRATITNYNLSKMMEIAKTHKELGGTCSAFVPINPIDSDGKLIPLSMCPSPKKYAAGLKEVFRSKIWKAQELYPFNEYMGRLKLSYKNRWGCGAPFGNTPVITTSGEIYSCIYLVGNKRYETGNINSDDFPRKKTVDYMMNIVDVNNRTECSQCSFKYLCGGGCPVGVFSIEGHPEATEKMKRYVKQISCEISKTVLKELLWEMTETVRREA